MQKLAGTTQASARGRLLDKETVAWIRSRRPVRRPETRLAPLLLSLRSTLGVRLAILHIPDDAQGVGYERI
jgi:hypothetical protein